MENQVDAKRFQEQSVELAVTAVTRMVQRWPSEDFPGLVMAIKPGELTDTELNPTEILICTERQKIDFNLLTCVVTAFLTRTARACFTAQGKPTDDAIDLQTGPYPYVLRFSKQDEDLSGLNRITRTIEVLI